MRMCFSVRRPAAGDDPGTSDKPAPRTGGCRVPPSRVKENLVLLPFPAGHHHLYPSAADLAEEGPRRSGVGDEDVRRLDGRKGR